MSEWCDLFTPIEGTVRILGELKGRGYKTYALSNYHLKAFERCSQRHSFFKLFDGLVISAKVKCLKPGFEIYNILLHEYGINPQETIFIDDTKENVDAARGLGFNTFRFSCSHELNECLVSYGIL